jgi:ribosome maturation factor RimP
VDLTITCASGFLSSDAVKGIIERYWWCGKRATARFFLLCPAGPLAVWLTLDALAKKIVTQVEALAEPLLESEGFALIDVEYQREPRGRTLRLVVDKDEGVTLEDCAYISRQLGDLLDAKADLLDSYHMEVSSPGLQRVLKKPKHFEQFKGRQVAIKTRSPIEDKWDFRGRLNGLSEGMVQVETGGRVYRIPYEEISKARLDL